MQTNLAHAIVRLGYHGPLNFGITHGTYFLNSYTTAIIHSLYSNCKLFHFFGESNYLYI